MNLKLRKVRLAVGGGGLVLSVVLLGFLWLILINQLRLEWSVNPQYAYGWAVPVLCLYLIGERVRNSTVRAASESAPSRPSTLLWWGVASCAFLLLPTRLLQEASPDWRLPAWLLAFEVAGLTLLLVRLSLGAQRLAQVAFPVCFFLVSVPWPRGLTGLLVQGLAGLNVFLTSEVLGWFGIAAIPHGNVIEVATGVVGVDEACSGIRSLQATLMISLFLGELYSLSVLRRALCVLAGFGLAFVFNGCRTFVLVWVAAKKGVPAIAEWHDPAGVSILVACFLVLWLVAFTLRPKPAAESRRAEPRTTKSQAFETVPLGLQSKSFQNLGWVLIGWLAFVESGTALWYRHLESNRSPGPAWTVNWPVENPTFKELAIPVKTRSALKFDQGRQAEWNEPEDVRWRVFYFHWLPGRAAGYLAKRHTPEVCLPSAGLEMDGSSELAFWDVQGLPLPFRSFVFKEQQRSLHVFYCRWEEGADPNSYITEKPSLYNLIRGVWAGRGNLGQKVLEIVVDGIEDPQAARAAAARQLDKLIKVDAASSGARPRSGTMG